MRYNLGPGDVVTVTWSTFKDTDSTVVFGTDPKNLDQKKSGHSDVFVDGGEEARRQFIHRVEIRNLKPKTKYCEYLNYSTVLGKCT